jgi:hypothetical protein
VEVLFLEVLRKGNEIWILLISGIEVQHVAKVTSG